MEGEGLKIKDFGRLTSNTEGMREAVKRKTRKNDHRKTPLQLKKLIKRLIRRTK